MSPSNTDRAAGHVPINHDFKCSQLAYDAPEAVTPCIKLTFFFRKLPDVSYEHFFKHCAHVHADLTVASKPFKVLQIQRYMQCYQTQQSRDKLKALGFPTLNYDAYSALWFRSWDDVQSFFSSKDQAKLGQDGQNFMDPDGFSVMATEDVILFGKGTPGLDVHDGVTEYYTTPQL